ncbi:MAG: O-antigen/teichoic acid export membrane protein [Desulforhopalus sp.]|jgi:O-antigen/teichoic acid export membrane protein
MIKQFIQQYKKNKRFKQVLGLFSVNLIGLPLGVITSIVVTRYLGPKGYGDFQFVHSIFNFAIIIFTMGFFQAGNRALVLNNDRQKAKEYYGAVLIIAGGLFIIMSISIVLYALNDPNVQEKNLRHFLLYATPFGWVFLLMKYFETLFQADNRIRLLAIMRLFSKIGFLITTVFVYLLLINLEYNRLAIIWICFLITQITVYCYILCKLGISFSNTRLRLFEIWNHNRSFGFNVYLGSLFAVGFSSLSGVLISYFGVDNSGVGFYSLALAFSAPLAFIPNTIATTHYKDFSNQKCIPPKLLWITLAMSFSALAGLWIIVGPFVHYFYGKEFIGVIKLSFIVSIGVILHGMADFFNRYLGANGQGKSLRNSSFYVGASVLVFNLLLIPKWGEYGAAYTRIISGSVYLFAMVLYYRVFTINETK